MTSPKKPRKSADIIIMKNHGDCLWGKEGCTFGGLPETWGDNQLYKIL